MSKKTLGIIIIIFAVVTIFVPLVPTIALILIGLNLILGKNITLKRIKQYLKSRKK